MHLCEDVYTHCTYSYTAHTEKRVTNFAHSLSPTSFFLACCFHSHLLAFVKLDLFHIFLFSPPCAFLTRKLKSKSIFSIVRACFHAIYSLLWKNGTLHFSFHGNFLSLYLCRLLQNSMYASLFACQSLFPRLSFCV